MLNFGCPRQLGNQFLQPTKCFHHVQIISDIKYKFKNDFEFSIIFFNIFTYIFAIFST